jgi:VanZ family protein
MNFRKRDFRHPLLWISLGWLLVVVIVYLSLARHAVGIPGRFGDKYGHVLAYAAVMLWFVQIYEGRRSRLVIAAGLAALGIGIEFAQSWTGYRMFEYADMVADCLGIAIGWLAGPPRTFNFLERLEKSI